ncbi:RNA ligase [Pseudomonas phage PhiPA3]|uniref:Uncharacterized protein 289 n=1 Tax=Pseudomonas phage PhiPA3 TaxID=998086 RepID=F8SJC5_BPPA3|nr:RNA ligase [Pseudomonas phage PhiPA3]AEH03712.1 hypothetical protein [Pseudomonas phage PhiPA3]
MENVLAELKPIKEGFGVVEETRKLARIVEIDDVIKHPNADALELAIVGGWQLCVKLGEYKKGDRAIYCEIDSLLPLSNIELFGFLEARRSDNRRVNGVNYHRLKTIKLRKELSQGLLVPVPAEFKDEPVDTNLTLKLGILKYESAPQMEPKARIGRDAPFFVKLGARLIGDLGGALLPWPSMLTKSDQDRIQNKGVAFHTVKEQGDDMEVTYKLDGSSMTVFCVNDKVVRTGVCSRNYELGTSEANWTFTEQVRYWLGNFLIRNRNVFKLRTWFRREDGVLEGPRKPRWGLIIPEWVKRVDTSDNNFIRVTRELKIREKLVDYLQATGRFITVQGELIGPDIQDNFEGVDKPEYYVYSVYEDGNIVLLPKEARKIVAELGLNYVPLFDPEWKPTAETTGKDVLAMAEGPSAFKNKRGYREGLVFKSNQRVLSWKAISNRYLLKQEEELEKKAKAEEAAEAVVA